MFLSHRSFVRPSLGSTRLSLRAAVRVRPCLARQCRPSVRDSVCPSASLFIPFNHCVMPFACRPSLHASLSLSLFLFFFSRSRSPFRNRTNRKSVRPSVSSLSIGPSLRLGKALKAASSSPSDATPQPMGEREGELTLLYFFADSISGSAGNNYLARPPVVPCPSGREGERNKKEKKALS